MTTQIAQHVPSQGVHKQPVCGGWTIVATTAAAADERDVVGAGEALSEPGIVYSRALFVAMYVSSARCVCVAGSFVCRTVWC